MNMEKKQLVVILGASTREDRYSHMALMRVREHGHRAIPVHPSYQDIGGIPVRPNLATVRQELGEEIADTLTIYLTPKITEAMTEEIVNLKPGRVIFNPGTESPKVQEALDKAAIPWQEACTLVLLGTGQF